MYIYCIYVCQNNIQESRVYSPVCPFNSFKLGLLARTISVFLQWHWCSWQCLPKCWQDMPNLDFRLKLESSKPKSSISSFHSISSKLWYLRSCFFIQRLGFSHLARKSIISTCPGAVRLGEKFQSSVPWKKKNPMKVQSRSKIRKPRHQRTAGSAGSSLSCQRAFPDKKLHGTSQCFSKVWKWKSHLAKSWWMLCPKSLKILPAGQELGQQEQPTFAASFSNIDFL